MLKAKLKDKLFNNNNAVEIDSLEGDVNGVSLQDCLDWVDEMKELTTISDEFIEFGKPLFLEEGTQLESTLKMYGINALLDFDAIPFFPDLSDQAHKFVRVNFDETGFEYALPSSLDLLSSESVQADETVDFNIYIPFTLTGQALAKITNKTILILTYSNCFTLGMIGQTGEGRVAGLLVYDSNGNAKLGHVKFKLTGTTLSVTTDVHYDFGANYPTAYLYAFSVK